MDCPACSYALSPFNPTCPRCAGKGLKGALRVEVPVDVSASPATLAASTAIAIPSTSVASSLTPVVPAPSATTTLAITTPAMPDADVSHLPKCCLYCGNTDIEKVVAIVRGGTWRQDSSWSEQTKIDARTTSAGFGVVWGDKDSSPVTTVSSGHTNGTAHSYGSASTVGASDLARLLAAPVAPIRPVRQPITEPMWKCLLGIPAAFLVFGGLHFWPLLVTFVFLGYIPLLSSTFKKEYEEAMKKHSVAVSNWRQRYAKWETLTYCRRCDHVSSQNEGKAVAARKISSLY